MQKFQPRVVVEEHALSSNVHRERFEIIFPQTSFIAVTAYQNQQVSLAHFFLLLFFIVGSWDQQRLHGLI